MKLNFKTRIALNYFVATGVVVALVFAVVYLSLKTTIYESLDSDLNYESEIHLEELNLTQMVFSRHLTFLGGYRAATWAFECSGFRLSLMRPEGAVHVVCQLI